MACEVQVLEQVMGSPLLKSQDLRVGDGIFSEETLSLVGGYG